MNISFIQNCHFSWRTNLAANTNCKHILDILPSQSQLNNARAWLESINIKIGAVRRKSNLQ